ncbi:MAG: DUF1956 domain-containing protein, partial [Armatimonadetes bacterium]|nr:DUF1956 domain-containing protein [Armatimonadota bacterium]
HRLLLAAGDVFAERGYRAATIREIVEKAGANIAAVNYHFGDKEALYTAVLSFVCEGAEAFARGVGEEADAPEEELHLFVRGFLERCLGANGMSWRGRLMAREMSEPTPAMKTLVDRVMQPTSERLVRLVRDACPALTDQEAWLCALSIIGQCTHHMHSEAIISRLDAPIPRGPNAIDALAAHITRFSLAAVRNYSDTRV